MRNRKIKFTTIAAIAFSVISSLLLLRCSLPPVANIILPSLQLQFGYGFSDKHLYLGCERLNDDIRTREKTTTGTFHKYEKRKWPRDIALMMFYSLLFFTTTFQVGHFAFSYSNRPWLLLHLNICPMHPTLFNFINWSFKGVWLPLSLDWPRIKPRS